MGWCLFLLFFFPRRILDEILNLIESVSEGFPSYFYLNANEKLLKCLKSAEYGTTGSTGKLKNCKNIENLNH